MGVDLPRHAHAAVQLDRRLAVGVGGVARRRAWPPPRHGPRRASDGSSRWAAAANACTRATSARTSMSASACFTAWNEPTGTTELMALLGVGDRQVADAAGEAGEQGRGERRPVEPARAPPPRPTPHGSPCGTAPTCQTGVSGSSGRSGRGSRAAGSTAQTPSSSSTTSTSSIAEVLDDRRARPVPGARRPRPRRRRGPAGARCASTPADRARDRGRAPRTRPRRRSSRGRDRRPPRATQAEHPGVGEVAPTRPPSTRPSAARDDATGNRPAHSLRVVSRSSSCSGVRLEVHARPVTTSTAAPSAGRAPARR